MSKKETTKLQWWIATLPPRAKILVRGGVSILTISVFTLIWSRPGNNARNAPERQMWGAPPCLYGTWRLVSSDASIPAQTQCITFHTNALLTRRNGDTLRTTSCRVELVGTSLRDTPVPVISEDSGDLGFAVERCDATHLTLDKVNASILEKGVQYKYVRQGTIPEACH